MLDRRDLLFWSAASAVPGLGRLAAADAPADPSRVFPAGVKPTDARLGPPKTLNGYFPFTPPKTVEEWRKRRQELREQLLVATGLWPMPDRTPLNPVIHGKVERDGYTLEKVFFASFPGHYVSGNLYRPTALKGDKDGPRAAVLSPHGHWPKGRFYEGSDASVEKELKSGAEQHKEAARYPIQARLVALARLGFVVFHYDMVGYADSTAVPHILRSAVPHPNGFADAMGELRLQSLMGLQTWNSVRALDFLEALPGVDPKRIGVTGQSGGGTQTFVLCAIDDRPAAAFPACMVSTAMQGGCVCENCSYLRVGTGNIELAAMMAPKPLALSAADDWTKELMTKGFPELKQLYTLLGEPDNVAAKAWLQYGHNFNRHAREFMESWFSKHLLGKPGDVTEAPFVPVPPAELSVFDKDHPRPADELDAPKLRAAMAKASDEQVAKLTPAARNDVVLTALRALVGPLPERVAVRTTPPVEFRTAGKVTVCQAVMSRRNEPDAVPAVAVLSGPKLTGKVVVWVHPSGKASLFENGEPTPVVRSLLDAGFDVLAPDLLGTGEATPDKPFAVDKVYAGFTYGYNRPLLANRVRDVLTAVAHVRTTLKAKDVRLVGWEAFGPVAVLAKALAGDAVGKTAADLNRLRFDAITDPADPMMLPGAVKYGGLPAFLELCKPGAVLAYNHAGTGVDRPQRSADKLPAEKVVAWLTT